MTQFFYLLSILQEIIATGAEKTLIILEVLLYLLLARLYTVYVGQTSNGRWRLSSLSVVVCNTGAYAT